MDRELFLSGFDLNDDPTSKVDSFNFTDDDPQTVDLMGMPCNKECYAISVAAVVTFLAGVYQVKKKEVFSYQQTLLRHTTCIQQCLYIITSS